jgi:hypothetical protein
VYQEIRKLLKNKQVYNNMAYAQNPYGDGKASERICDSIKYTCVYSVPITFNVPASTPSGLSVTSLRTKTGLFKDRAY